MTLHLIEGGGGALLMDHSYMMFYNRASPLDMFLIDCVAT